jgi:glycosyltransferase involved in cell wall biosynthesis
MRIVIGCDTANPYVGQLAQSLSAHQEVGAATDSLYQFWRPPEGTDILHIQWPEALYHWKDPQVWEVARLAEMLQEWSSNACIVTTVHNYKPHNIENYQRLYRLVYKASDGIVHLGEASRDWFFEQYDFASGKRHAIIPHGNYSCFPDDVTDDKARKHLGIGAEEFVCLCFGELRHHRERALLIEAFDRLSGWRNKLVIAGGGEIPTPSRRTFQYWRIKYDPRLCVDDEWILDEDVQLYLRAADVVVIPREGVLNSGTVALGFTFERPVVGPDEGVIGEVLRKTGNPVYEPGDDKALAEAMEMVKGDSTELGEQNKVYAAGELSWRKISLLHKNFYLSLKSDVNETRKKENKDVQKNT